MLELKPQLFGVNDVERTQKGPQLNQRLYEWQQQLITLSSRRVLHRHVKHGASANHSLSVNTTRASSITPNQGFYSLDSSKGVHPVLTWRISAFILHLFQDVLQTVSFQLSLISLPQKPLTMAISTQNISTWRAQFTRSLAFVFVLFGNTFTVRYYTCCLTYQFQHNREEKH